jgi:hypothetical protein
MLALKQTESSHRLLAPPLPPIFYAIILFYSKIHLKSYFFIILLQCFGTGTGEPERFLVMESVWIRIKHEAEYASQKIKRDANFLG